VLGYGKVAKDRETQPDGNTIFEIGSATKVFTTIALADMVKDGLVAFDDPISKLLPSSVKAPTYEGKEITLVHLATHTSGLPRIPGNLLATTKDAGNPYANYAVSDLYEFLSNHKLQREPGKDYEYSNLGMGLLGHLLALKSGTTYEELVVKRICDRLDMKDTRIGLSPEQQTRLAKGHSIQALPVSNWDIPTLAGAGALRSTVNDMLKFVAANLGQSNTSLTGVLESCHTVRVKPPNPRLEVALGWHVVPLDEGGRKIIWHNGGTGGYRSFIGFVKESKTGVVVLSNSGNSVDDIGVRLLKLLNSPSQ
jgi:CubicO group peptidase (beta-lactamase class C family)